MSNGSTEAEKSKWKNLRASPRRLTPDELHQRAVARRDAKRVAEKYALEARKAAIEGDYSRKQKARASLHNAYTRSIRRTAELGIAPVYRGHDRDSGAQRAWVKAAREWDRSA